ncbi:alpha/beta hydrolase [Xenophilus sp.]|uniref:alpha/beta hydrolase n=1 Tax=Xenophilus sp. TaxID=1873499 RepID=UPI0037DBF2D0
MNVYLPPSYRSGSGTYPSIYVLDADARYNNNEPRFQSLRTLLARSGKEAILVGIGNTARRDVDYAFPGGRQYHDFLAKQLVPTIESRYRADPARRMITGLSLGGSFVVGALFIEAPETLVFQHFLSFDGAFHGDYLAQLKSLDQQARW